jgi:glucosyl-3-phosphoglycerate synthase
MTPARPVQTAAQSTPSALSIPKVGSTVSVVLPARNEAATIGLIVHALKRELMDRHPFLHELIVMDHDSTDDTAIVARAAGATVVSAGDVLAEMGPALGKGDVLWRSLAATSADIVVWLDADLEHFDPHLVRRLAGPLLASSDVHMVRPIYRRMNAGVPREGGRTTELAARPILSLVRPELADVREPLAGEYAVRRSTFMGLPFEIDYGVEIGLLMDLHTRFGRDAIAEVDLGTRVHRNRPLADLGPQAQQVLRSALARAHRMSAPLWLNSATTRPPVNQALRSRELLPA